MGNSLQDILTFGRRAGINAAKYIRSKVAIKKPALDHVVRFEKELADSGIENPAVAPKLLPDYSTDEVISRRWMDSLMEME